MELITWQRTRNSIIKGVVIVVLSMVSGIGGSYIFYKRQTQALTASQMSDLQAVTTKNEVSMQGSRGNYYNGLPELNQKWVQPILSGDLETSTGQVVRLDPSRPILMVAYWSTQSLGIVQLFNAHHLLDKVQIVAVGFNGTEVGGIPQLVSSLPQAVSLFDEAMKRIKVDVSQQNLLFALPGSSVDAGVNEYPIFLSPHGGHWYYLTGFTSNAEVYKTALLQPDYSGKRG